MATSNTILQIDDDSNNALFVRFALERLDLPHRLEHVSSGFAAMRYLRGEDGFSDRERHPVPDLILLDLRMAPMDGFEVLEWLRLQPDLSEVPVCILTGGVNPAEVSRAYRLGANFFIMKPSSLDELVRSIKNLFENLGAHGLQRGLRTAERAIDVPANLAA